MLPSGYPGCKPMKHWRSVDTHFQEVVAMLSPAFSPIMTANNVIRGVCHRTAFELSRIQDHKSFTIRWRTFLKGSSDVITSIFANKGSRYCDYGCIPLQSPWIIQNAGLKIVDAQWGSFWEGGSNIVTGLCGHNGAQYCDYGFTLSHSAVIIKDARPEIGDAPLRPISRIQKEACDLPLYIYSLRITPLWIDVTM